MHQDENQDLPLQQRNRAYVLMHFAIQIKQTDVVNIHALEQHFSGGCIGAIPLQHGSVGIEELSSPAVENAHAKIVFGYALTHWPEGIVE